MSNPNIKVNIHNQVQGDRGISGDLNTTMIGQSEITSNGGNRTAISGKNLQE